MEDRAVPMKTSTTALIRAKTQKGKHDEVLRTAARLFSSAGYSGTSVEDIAAAVGVTKGALYHYFSNKSDILYALYLEVAEQITTRFSEHPRDADPQQRLRLIIRDMLSMIEERPIELTVYLQESPLLSSYLPRRLARDLRQRESEVTSYVVDTIEDGMAQGIFRPGNPSVTAFAIIGMVTWMSRWYRRTGPLTIDSIAEILYGIAENGIT
jgi:AcrR family transcriptional regulator